jgi:hypothetical protein
MVQGNFASFESNDAFIAIEKVIISIDDEAVLP